LEYRRPSIARRTVAADACGSREVHYSAGHATATDAAGHVFLRPSRQVRGDPRRGRGAARRDRRRRAGGARAADDVTHEILRKLNSTFVTPFDRGDIYALAGALDDCMDEMDAAADLIALYRIEGLPAGAAQQARILRRQAELTAQAMPELRSLNGLESYWVEINRLENEADHTYRAMLADLFNNGTDAIAVLKIKEVIDLLESAADAFEQVAHHVETIAVKES
jgi:uncharacterized protein